MYIIKILSITIVSSIFALKFVSSLMPDENEEIDLSETMIYAIGTLALAVALRLS